jgi:5-nitroimidazole antibiotic resistance protein nimA
MRRFNQLLSNEESINILNKNTSGVLAVYGDNGYPYAVPLSYLYYNNKIYFHCAKSGHKLDAIRNYNKVSFCVIDMDNVVPEEYTTYFRSVIVFGKAKILLNEEMRKPIEMLAEKYSPDDEVGRLNEIEQGFNHMSMIEISIEHLTGKESIELIKNKNL